MMTKVLITGAAGFTGRYFSAAMCARGFEVHGLVHGETTTKPDGAYQSHCCDLTHAEALTETIAAIKPDLIAHLAAISFVAHNNVEEMYSTNVIGTRNLLEAVTRANCNPKAFLVASSANIYGNAYSGVIHESFTPAPVNDYGVTKIAAEYAAKIYSENLPIIITRPFNYTGVGQRVDFVIPKIIDHVRRRAPEIELGNIDVARDISDVRSVVNAYIRLLETPSSVGKIFNVCSGKATTLRSILQIVSEISGHDFRIAVNPTLLRRNEVKTLTGSRALLDDVIGPLDIPPIEDTLRWMLNN